MKRALTVVVSFATATDALAMESAARRCGLEGRLAPIPRQLSAGCGLAWREPASNEGALLRVIADGRIRCDGFAVMELQG